MSKSKGNIVDPWQIIDKYGADSLRWYFYTLNQPGASKLFSEKHLQRSLRKFLMTYWNCYNFLEMYKKKGPLKKNLLDRWILSKFNKLIAQVTESLDQYDIVGSARKIEEFVVNDLSLWYIRRSRKRFQEQGSSVLYSVISDLAKLTAPFVPFISEEIYPGKQSVHLTDWPKPNNRLIDERLEKEIGDIRKIVALGLKIRSNNSIKVRQPLSMLAIEKRVFDKELLDLVKEELNVKEVVVQQELEKSLEITEEEGLRVGLDVEITPELERQGLIREIVRQVQQMRKEAALKPKDKIIIFAQGEWADFIEKNKELFLSQTKADDLKIKKETKAIIQKEITLKNKMLWLGLKVIVE